MHRFLPALLPACLVMAALDLQAQTNDLPALDTARLLQELQTLVDQQESQAKTLRSQKIKTLQPATTGGPSAVNLYEDAMKAQLDSRGQKPSFSDWRRDNAEELRSSSFQAAAQMLARYLQMGLEYNPENPEASANASWEYAEALARVLSDPKLAPSSNLAKNLLQKPAKDSEIARWLEIGPSLPPDKAWSPLAGNLVDILNKNIRPVWREKKDPRLLATWDLQIGQDQDPNNPSLLFRRAQDLAIIGQPNRAATEILLLAQKNTTHPEFSQWVNELKKLLATPTPATPASP